MAQVLLALDGKPSRLDILKLCLYFFFICFRFTDRKYTGCFRIDPEIWLLSILHMIVVKQKQRRMESNSHVESWNVWKFESSPNIS